MNYEVEVEDLVGNHMNQLLKLPSRKAGAPDVLADSTMRNLQVPITH